MPEYLREDLRSIAHELRKAKLSGVANDIYWWSLRYHRSFICRTDPKIYEVMMSAKEQMPLLINSKEPGIRTIAKARLKIGK